jgi:hypothetical protein
MKLFFLNLNLISNDLIFMVKYSLPVVFLFFSLKVFTQHPVPFYQNSINDIFATYEKDQIELLYELYYHKIDPSYELINGRGYFRYYHRSGLKPILFSGKDHSSSLTLKGRKYDNITLDFDTYTDEVIYTDSTRICVYSPLMVAINKDYVDGFEFYNGNDTIFFRYFSKETDPLFDLNDGYYEVVSDKESKYLIKHISFLKKLPGTDEYTYLKVGYVNIGNGFSKISTSRQFIKIFGARSDEVRKYIKESGIKIRDANKEQIMCVLKYHDSLKDQIR